MQEGDRLCFQFTCQHECGTCLIEGINSKIDTVSMTTRIFTVFLICVELFHGIRTCQCSGPTENIHVGNTCSVPNAVCCCSLLSIVTLLSLSIVISTSNTEDFNTEEPLLVLHPFSKVKQFSVSAVFARGGFRFESWRKRQWVSLLCPADQGAPGRIPWLSVKIRTTHCVKDVSGAVYEFPRMKLIKPVILDKAGCILTHGGNSVHPNGLVSAAAGKKEASSTVHSCQRSFTVCLKVYLNK